MCVNVLVYGIYMYIIIHVHILETCTSIKNIMFVCTFCCKHDYYVLNRNTNVLSYIHNYDIVTVPHVNILHNIFLMLMIQFLIIMLTWHTLYSVCVCVCVCVCVSACLSPLFLENGR